MTQLTDDKRKELWAEFMSLVSSERSELAGITKQELKVVVDVIDNWIEAAIPSFLAAIPSPGNTALTAKQKLYLFNAIVKKRWEVN